MSSSVVTPSVPSSALPPAAGPVHGTSARGKAPLPGLCVLAAIASLLFFLQLRHFSPFMTDDAYISLRYSQRLLEGHGLTWNDMRPVEGYTNLLWVLACAGLGALGSPLPLAAHLLGITTTVAVLVAIVAFIYRNYPRPQRFFAALLACGALALSSPFSMWALGGLEQPLLACMLVWAALLMLEWLEYGKRSRATLIGMLLGLAVLARADAALFTAAFFAAAVATDAVGAGTTGSFPDLRRVVSRARILPIPILFFAGQVAFRRSYYHEWLPNTAFVKVAFTAHRVYTGLRYLYLGLRIDAVFLVLAVLGGYALWRAGKRKTVVFLVTVALLWTSYVVVIGGDIFPAVRHFEPIVALFGFLVAGCGLLAVTQSGAWRRNAAMGLLVLTALVASSDAMTDQEHWEEQGKSLGLFLHQAFGDKQPLLSSDAAGVVPFYAHFPVLDPLGLNDYHIAHEASRSRGYGWVGHELGDGKYILDQKPDLLLFSSFEGDGPLFAADQQIVADPRFAAFYQEVRFDTPQPNAIRALMYIRRIDGKLGVQSLPGQITIPAYLEETDRNNSIHLLNSRAVLTVAPYGSATYRNIAVPGGNWRVRIEGPATNNPSDVKLDRLSAATLRSSCDLCFEADSGSFVSFTLRNTTPAPLTLQSIILEKE